MRYLVCTDPVPATDGTCANAVWIEQADVTQFFPTVAEAVEVGWYFMATLMILAAAKHFLKPRR